MRLILSEEAEADLREIARFAKGRWGTERAREYVHGLRAKLKLLCTHPELGPAADEIRPGLRRCSYLSHHALYRVHRDHIRIVRILHKQMQAKDHV